MGSRYVNDLVLNMDPMDVENAVQDYLRGNDFKLVFEKGEHYYKAGGVMFPLRGFKYGYQNGILHLEAWNGKIGKEYNIGDGKLRGAAAKVPYYNSILSLMKWLEAAKPAGEQSGEPVRAQTQVQSETQFQPDVQGQAPTYTQQPGTPGQATSAIANEVSNANNRNSQIAFWLSIASLILMFASRFGLLINIFSYTLAIKYGLKSQKSGLSIAAIVINSVVIVITLLMLFI